MKEIYLDWAASAPATPKASRAFERAAREYGNPSSPHAAGARAKKILEDARVRIARVVEVKQDAVIFTSGATEANALALQGYVKMLRSEQVGLSADSSAHRKAMPIHLLYLPTAHASVIETMQALAGWGVEIEPLVITDGAIDLAVLKKQLRPETALVSMDVVCGETGTRFATRDVRRVLDAFQKEQMEKMNEGKAGEAKPRRIVLHADASQAPFVESIEHTHLGADLITLDAQKVGGVRGIGALIRPNPLLKLRPIMYGGGQEQGLRPGTENPALAIAFATALEEAQEGREEFVARARSAREEFIATLTESLRVTSPSLAATASASPLAFFENTGKEFAPHILNLSFPGIDTDYLVMLLSQSGFFVSTKSACETDADGSRVVFALTNDSARSSATLRISWGPTTPSSNLQKFAKALIKSLNFLGAHKI